MVTLSINEFSYDSSEKSELKNIHTSFSEGSCVVITGKSGCGKSTLLRLINRLIPNFYKGKLDGSIMIEQKNINDYTNDELVLKVGCVFQNPSSQFFNIDTESEIAFGCENLGISREQIERHVIGTSEILNINHLLDRSIFSLSGGEKQMIAIASIYAIGVDVFLMDEPSANLDMEATKQLEKVIGILKAQGKTVIIAEHRLHYLKEHVDRLLILEDGMVKEDFPRDAINKLSTDDLHGRGLRAINLEDIVPSEVQATPDKSILIENLTVGYKSNPAVIDGLYDCFGSGIVNGIVGHNGRGKTTFAKCLCGMLKEDKGSIAISGKRYSCKKRLGKIYMVLQNTTSQLFADSVIGELIIAERTSKSNCGYSNDEVLGMLGLSHLKNRHPMSLSGGEKQRLAIAVGIIQNSEVIVLDEPTSGLDYASMKAVKELLGVLRNQEKYIIVITHDHEFLTSVCDRVIEL